jgi:hypothetical protein
MVPNFLFRIILVLAFYLAIVTGSDKSISQSKLEKLNIPIYQMIFNFLDFDFDSMTFDFVKLQLLNQEMNQRIQHAVQLYYKNVKDDIQTFCTENSIFIPPVITLYFNSSITNVLVKTNDYAHDISCKRKRISTHTKTKTLVEVDTNQNIDGLNFVKQFIDHFSKIFMNALQQKNDYPDAFLFYHELFEKKNNLPVHISRLLIFAIAKSFEKDQRRQIFNENKIKRLNSTDPFRSNFVYDFRVNKLYVINRGYHTKIAKNMQLPLFFLSSCSNPNKGTQIFCLTDVGYITQHSTYCFEFNQFIAKYYIIWNSDQSFTVFEKFGIFDDLIVKPCFNLKSFC